MELETIQKIAGVYNDALKSLVERATRIIGDEDLAADFVYQVIPLETVTAEKLITPWRQPAPRRSRETVTKGES